MSELTTQLGNSEADILQRIKLARGTAEPEQAPTEEPTAVDVSEEEAPVEEVVEEVSDTPLEAEESEVEDTEATTEDEEDLYVEYKGREISLKDIEEWESGQLRQSDYTRKTQELADQRKEFEAEREEFTAKQAKLTDQLATLEAIIAEDTLSAEDLAEMREYEPEKYIAHQEKLAKRKELLEEAKANSNTSSVDVNKEQQLLVQNNPEWFENGQVTKAYEEDVKLMQDYGLKAGFTAQELQGFNTARMYDVLKKAAKFDQLSKKNSAIEKKVRKAPVSTKPKKSVQPALVEQIKKQEAIVKKTGNPQDFVKLRQLKRQLKGN